MARETEIGVRIVSLTRGSICRSDRVVTTGRHMDLLKAIARRQPRPRRRPGKAPTAPVGRAFERLAAGAMVELRLAHDESHDEDPARPADARPDDRSSV